MSFESPDEKTDELLRDRAPRAAFGGGLALWAALGAGGEAKTADDRTAAFIQLRADTHARMQQELTARIATNPTATAAERSLGTYAQGIEPQVRSAVFAINAKGYRTISSGFHASEDSWRTLGLDNPARTYDPREREAQTMDFGTMFTLTDEARTQLSALGAEAVSVPGAEGLVSRIGFVPDSPDLASIEATWNAIAGILPDTGIAAPGNNPDLAPTYFAANSHDIGVTPGVVAQSDFAPAQTAQAAPAPAAPSVGPPAGSGQ